jgi:ParB/RepB/Spo0J family partition protein
MTQYVEIETAPEHRHILRTVFNGKSKKGGKQALTACGQPFAVDDAIIFAQPSSELMDRKAAPPCPACNGDEETPAVAATTAIAVQTNAVIEWLSPAKICASPFNHRKKFTALDELATSLIEKGMISPITVRPRPSYAGERDVIAATPYELVVGERRWRASVIAKLAVIPVIVRNLTDKQVLEIQLVENVQRVDVHQLEEADGYRELIDKHGHDVDSIAAKTGKSKATIYARLKLCALAPYPRKAFLEDRLPASTALLIARIPDVGLQEKAAREILGQVVDEKSYDPGEPLCEERRDLTVLDEKGKEVEERQPMSVREAQVHIQRRYMLRLELAKFDIADAQLVAKAGACTVCPKRTGNQPTLFADIKNKDVCTDRACFDAKSNAAFEIKAQAAAAAGAKVVKATEAKKVFDVRGEVARSSPYVDPKASVPWDITGDYSGKGKSWEQMLGKKLAGELPTVVVQNPETGAAHELIDKKAALEKLREVGKIDKPRKSSGSGIAPTDWEAERAKDEKKRQINRAARVAATRIAMDKANSLEAKKELAWWRWIAFELMESNSRIVDATSPCVTLALGREANQRAEWIEQVLDKLNTVSKARAFVTGAFFEESCPSAFNNKAGDAFVVGAKLFGVNWDKHLDEAKEKAKQTEKLEKAAADAKEEKKAPAKKGGKGRG